MTRLTGQEKLAIGHNRQLMAADDWPAEMTVMARALADEFRAYFTDIDDVTLARVLLVVGGKLASLATSTVMLGTPVAETLVVRLGVAFGAAATELAAMEAELPD